MKTFYANDFDSMIRDFIGMAESAAQTASQHPFFKDLQDILKTAECKCEDGKCDCKEAPETNAPVNGILHSHVKTFSDKYVMIAEIPGLEDKDISIEFKENKLTVKAEYPTKIDQDKSDEENFSVLRVGTWITSFKFKDVDSEQIAAKLDRGQLKIVLPKKPEAQPLKVQINK